MLDWTLLWAALLLGLRHSLDVDHLAATADIAGTQSTRSKALWGCFGYTVGHAGIVLLIGGIGIMLGLSLPESLSAVMEKVVAVTLLILAGAIVYSAIRSGPDQPLLSRWRIMQKLGQGIIDRIRKPSLVMPPPVMT